jgi:hypothetical protein
MCSGRVSSSCSTSGTRRVNCSFSSKLTLQCQLPDPTSVTNIYHIKIQQKNISELYEDVVTVRFRHPNNSVVACMKENLFIVDSIHYIVYVLTKLTSIFFPYSKTLFPFIRGEFEYFSIYRTPEHHTVFSHPKKTC